MLQNICAYDVDVIITKSREQIQCLILSIDENNVTYNSADQNDTLIYNIAYVDIEKIYLRTGEIISNTPNTPAENIANDTSSEKAIEQQEEIADTPFISDEESNTPMTTLVVPVVEPDNSLGVERRQQEETSKARHATNEDLKSFTRAIYGSVEEIEQEQRERQTLTVKADTVILLFIIGLDNNQNDIKRIFESDLISKLNTIENYVVQQYDSTITYETDTYLLDVARKKGVRMICVVRVIPFNEEFYVQTRIVDSTEGRLLALSTLSSPLISVNDILTATETIAAEIKEQRLARQPEVEDKSSLQVQEEQERQTREYEERQNTQEQYSDLQAQVQQMTGNLIQSISNLQTVENTYALDIVNTKNYPCRVVLAGHQIGIVQPHTKQRFLISTDLYGKAQLIQTRGYFVFPTEVNYNIPKQVRRATITLTM